jgi:hypothetical protein
MVCITLFLSACGTKTVPSALQPSCYVQADGYMLCVDPPPPLITN